MIEILFVIFVIGLGIGIEIGVAMGIRRVKNAIELLKKEAKKV